MSAERGHGSKSRVHFLGYSLIRCVGHGVGQAVDPHFDPHLFQRFCNKKAPKTEAFDAFWSALTKKMQEQSLVSQGFAGF